LSLWFAFVSWCFAPWVISSAGLWALASKELQLPGCSSYPIARFQPSLFNCFHDTSLLICHISDPI
jgi:hypothetical protein